MELFQLTQGTQGTRKNSALYGSSNHASNAETATDENGFSYKDLLEQFQDQRNLGKKNQQETSRKSNPSTPIKETPAADMLKNLSFMSGSFNVASNAVLGSSAGKNVELKKVLMGDFNDDGILDIDDVMAIRDHIIEKKKITDPNMIKRMDLNSDGEIDVLDLTKLTNTVIGREEKKYLEIKNEPMKSNPDNVELKKVLMGDFNDDGILDTDDVMAIQDHILEKKKITDPNMIKRMDLNSDGEIDVFDITKLMNTFIGREEKKYLEIKNEPMKSNPDNEGKVSDVEKIASLITEEPNSLANTRLGPANIVREAKTNESAQNQEIDTKKTETQPSISTVISDTPAKDDDKENHTIEIKTRYLGDLDGNGKITPKDVTRVMEYVRGMRELTDDELEYADMNQDGVVDKEDETILGRIFVDLEPMRTKNQNENKKLVQESEQIKDELKDIIWYNAPELEPKTVPEVEPIPEEVSALKFGALAGDITGDGRINISDANLIAEYIRGDIKADDNRIVGNMDINNDGMIDEIDYSIMYNLAIGKDMHSTPGSSEDNPIYIVSAKYKSNNPKGEYVSTLHLMDSFERSLGYSHEKENLFFLAQGDELIHESLTRISGHPDFGENVVIMSDQPHSIIIPRFTSLYKGYEGYENHILKTQGSVEVIVDEDDKISVNPIDSEYLNSSADSLFIDMSKITHMDVWGDNSVIKIDYAMIPVDDPLVDDPLNYKNTLINIMGDNLTVIREHGASEDIFHLTPSAKKLDIQNNDTTPFFIEVPYGLDEISLKNINGIPTIVPIYDYYPIPLISLKGNITPKVILKGKNGEELALKNISGADEVFKSNETNLKITIDTVHPQWISKTYTRNVQDGGESFNEELGDINSKFTVSDGNYVTISESNDKIKEVIPNLTMYNGKVDVEKGDIKLKVDDKDYIKGNGAATYTRDLDKIKVEAKEAINLETLEDSDNVEINAFIGDNTITLNGKKGKVFTGGGNDEVVINGEDSSVFLLDGNNDITISAPSYVQAGKGKDNFLVKTHGVIINEFDPNDDTLNLSLSLGKLTFIKSEKAGYPIFFIQNEETRGMVCALSNPTGSDEIQDKIQEIVKTHNERYDLNETENRMAVIQRELADQLERLTNEMIETYQNPKQGLIENLTKKISIQPSSAKVSENMKADFAEAVAEAVETSKIKSTSFSSMEQFLGQVKNGLEPIKTENGMSMYGATVNGAYAFWAFPDNNSLATMSIASDNKESQAAINDYLNSLKTDLGEKLDDATKEVISAITGISKKKVSAGYDIGMVLIDIMSGKKPDMGKVTDDIWNLAEDAIFGFVNKSIHHVAEKKTLGDNMLDVFNGTLWEKNAINGSEDFRNVIDFLVDTQKQYDGLKKNFIEDGNASLNEKLKKLEGFVNYLSGL